MPPKSTLFWAKNVQKISAEQPENPFKTAEQLETVATPYVHLDFIVSKCPLVPSNSTICPRKARKNASKGSKMCAF